MVYLIFLLIKFEEGLKMCIEQRIAKQKSDNERKAKYEMGNFCEQYGILPIAPSQKKYIKHKNIYI